MKILKMLWKLIPLLNEILSVSKKKKKFPGQMTLEKGALFMKSRRFPAQS